MRPASLAAVAARTAHDGAWAHHLDEFLDDFYRADGDGMRQAAMIAAPPAILGADVADAVIGGAGEHLARRWDLPIPSWVRCPSRYLGRAMFWPDADGLRDYLLAASPVSFRTRLIFTGPEPLQRARFPYHRGTRTLPLDFPPAAVRDTEG